MTPTQLTLTVRQYCQTHANPANVEKYSRFFRGEFDAYGLTSPDMEEGVKVILSDPSVTVPVILAAAPDLVVSSKYEETGFVLLMLNGRKKYYTREVFVAIESWFLFGIRNWAHADILGMWILPDLIKQGVIGMEDLRPWLSSEFKFQRRCVPVTLIKSLKSTEDFTELFDFIGPLMSDPEREVHQGAGWFLREAWKLKRPVTEQFLMRHRNTAPRLIIQYATEKMTKEERLRFRRDK